MIFYLWYFFQSEIYILYGKWNNWRISNSAEKDRKTGVSKPGCGICNMSWKRPETIHSERQIHLLCQSLVQLGWSSALDLRKGCQIVFKPHLCFTSKFKIASIIPLQVFFVSIWMPHNLATNLIRFLGKRWFNYFWNPIKSSPLEIQPLLD